MSWPAIAAAPAKNEIRQNILSDRQLLVHLFLSSRAGYLVLQIVNYKDLPPSVPGDMVQV